jgi:hypothetical protein
MAVDPMYNTPCHGSLSTTMGLPCWHVMRKRIASEGILRIDDIAKFWWIERVYNSICSFEFPGKGKNFIFDGESLLYD